MHPSAPRRRAGACSRRCGASGAACLPERLPACLLGCRELGAEAGALHWARMWQLSGAREREALVLMLQVKARLQVGGQSC